MCRLISKRVIIDALNSKDYLILFFRFIVIVFPMKSRSICTMTNCCRSLIFVWGLSLLLAAPVIWTKVCTVPEICFFDFLWSADINYTFDYNQADAVSYNVFTSFIIYGMKSSWNNIISSFALLIALTQRPTTSVYCPTRYILFKRQIRRRTNDNIIYDTT